MARTKKFSNSKRGVALSVRVIPRSSRTEIVEVLSDQTIKIRVKAPPVDGKANQELIKFLSKILGVPKTNIEIIAGDTGRNKLISILGTEKEDVEKKILNFIK